MAPQLWSRSSERLDPRNPPPGEEADAIRRDRLLATMAELAGGAGYVNTKVNELALRARLSASTFYRLYPSKEACFLAAYDDAVEHALELVVEEWRAGGSVARERFERALRAFLDFCASHPHVARMCLVEAPALGRDGHERREAAIQRAAAVSAHALPGAAGPGRGRTAAAGDAVAHTVVGGIAHLVTERIRAGDTESLASLAAALTDAVFPPSTPPRCESA